MDYKSLKSRTNAVKRERILWITIIIMIIIIIVQAVVIFLTFSTVNHYKAMYDESLNERITMQEKINSLTGSGDVGANYSAGGESQDDENTADDKTEIPFVTEGKELDNESGIDN